MSVIALSSCATATFAQSADDALRTVRSSSFLARACLARKQGGAGWKSWLDP